MHTNSQFTKSQINLLLLKFQSLLKAAGKKSMMKKRSHYSILNYQIIKVEEEKV